MTQSTAYANGQQQEPPSPERIEQLLTGEPLSAGYRPTLPLWATWTTGMTDQVPQLYLVRDVELMMIHPIVLNALNYFKAGVAGAEFDIEAEDQEVGDFVLEQCQRFWDRGVPRLQGGYEYGWIGCEAMYTNDEGMLKFDDLIDFSPRDVFLLTQDRKPVGVRVKSVPAPGSSPVASASPSGTIDLWSASEDIPAKGLWYAHNPRYSQWYGQSQLQGAWRPWRRLAWKDGAEMVIDGGIYRFAYAGPVIKYPEEDFIGPAGSPATTLDSQGRPRRFARDIARQLAEQAKTGASVGLPSTTYQDGTPKWDWLWPTTTLNVAGLMEYATWLQNQITIGIGVPPELLEAAETGSGYSGRRIPLEGFMAVQQRFADSFLKLFMDQVVRPMVRWNFGMQKFEAKVKNLLQTKAQMLAGESGEQAPEEGAMPGGAPTPQGVPQMPGMGMAPIPGAGMSLLSSSVRRLADRILRRAA